MTLWNRGCERGGSHLGSTPRKIMRTSRASQAFSSESMRTTSFTRETSPSPHFYRRCSMAAPPSLILKLEAQESKAMDRSPSSMRIARTRGDVSWGFSLLLYPACGVRVGGRRMLFFFVPNWQSGFGRENRMASPRRPALKFLHDRASAGQSHLDRADGYSSALGAKV